MSFIETLDNLALKKSELVERFENLIAPKSDQALEAMAQASRSLTRQNFGRTMRLFAPLYLSNECINNCRYCGFSRDNPILRVTLDVDEVVAEGQHLAHQGFRQILLVDFNFRLDCAERGYAAGFRRLGIGALIGLSRWQDEAIALAAHLEHLFKHCWQAQITVSVPRLRPAVGGFRPLFSMTDREFAQLVCALRITFPQLGIVLSTRERAPLRDSLALIGVTIMSAGSHTEPGGYTRRGREHLHRTVRGRIVAPEYQAGEDQLATGQFEISDERSPAEIAAVLRRRGLEPVWKDWDQALCGA